MTDRSWPQPKNRIVVHGRVDDRSDHEAWIVIDDAIGIGTRTALLRIPVNRLVPELPAHVALRQQWHSEDASDHVLLTGRIIPSLAPSGRLLVSVSGTGPYEGEERRLLVFTEQLIFGQRYNGND